MNEKVTGDWFERYDKERTELLDKIANLGAFLETDAFEKLDQLDRDDLKMQYHAMNIYLTALEHIMTREYNRRKEVK